MIIPCVQLGLPTYGIIIPPQHRVGLEINRNILSCRLYWLKLQHSWPRSNIPYTAPEPQICCFESTGNASNAPSCLERSLWIPNTKFHLGVQVLYMLHFSLARDVAVSINTTYKIVCCNWFLIQPCTEVDNDTIC